MGTSIWVPRISLYIGISPVLLHKNRILFILGENWAHLFNDLSFIVTKSDDKKNWHVVSKNLIDMTFLKTHNFD